MKRLGFYFRYAWRSVLRGGQRTIFAILCVAVGVASLVALLSLAQSIRETLTGDIQARAGGDITARTGYTTADKRDLPSETVNLLNNLVGEGLLTDWTTLSYNTVQIKNYFSFPPTLYTVDPAKFPMYGKVELVQPAGGDFRQILAGQNNAIVSRNLFEKNGYKLGDELEVTTFAGQNPTGRSAKLKIAGVAKTDLPGVPFDTGIVFGFLFVSQPTAGTFLDSPTASNQAITIYMKTPPGQSAATIKNNITRRDQNSVQNERGRTVFQLANVRTAAELQEQLNRNLALTEDLLSYVGLLAILIGGIGVVNTMLVVIGRRTTEIATVKALGLKTRQTLIIFTLEAMMLGLLGSILGLILGVALGFGIKGVAEGLFFRPLNWGLYPEPLIVGLIVGIVTAGVFGFLPAYAAARVRPGVVLRQYSSALPRIGGFATIVIVALMTLALGIVGGFLIRDMTLGIIIGYVTLFMCLFLTAFMYFAVFIFGKLPAPFGPSLKMALRNFSRSRGRTATTLLVMVVGLFFMTFITVIADSIKTSFRQAFDLNLGYNVVALNPLGGTSVQTLSRLQSEVPEVRTAFMSNQAPARLVTINGQTPQLRETAPTTPVPGRPQSDGTNATNTFSVNLNGRSLANDNKSLSPNGPQSIVGGRTFTAEDAGKPVLLVNNEEAARWGVNVGDKVVLAISPSTFGGNVTRNSGVPPSKSVEFTVIGIVAQEGAGAAQFESGWVAPFQTVAENGGSFSIVYMLIDQPNIKTGLAKAQSLIPGGFVFDLSDLIDTFTRILDQILAFPLLLSLLSLFSGAILIANNVALAMLERRTEIGVLKAIGAKRRRVLNMLLWESSFVGLLGGAIGIGTGILLAVLLPALLTATGRNGNFPVIWSPMTAGLLLGLGILLAIAATIVSAWGAVQEKPLVVLRYE
jgi:putative ABC transport system permease protein